MGTQIAQILSSNAQFAQKLAAEEEAAAGGFLGSLLKLGLSSVSKGGPFAPGGTFSSAVPTTTSGGSSAKNAAISAATQAAVTAAISSSDFKENFVPAGPYLEQMAKLDIGMWNYKPELGDPDTHIGPMAEDFQRLFGVGDGRHIRFIDVLGVLMKTVKELNAELIELRRKVEG